MVGGTPQGRDYLEVLANTETIKKITRSIHY